MRKKFPLTKLLFAVSSVSITGILAIFTPVTAISVANAYINFAGAGGDFSSRTATFLVPESTAVTPVKNGLRLYEVHLAKMIEVSESYCQDRESDYLIHWIYKVDQGKIFMGQFSWSCQFARDTLKKFGSSGTEKMTIHHRGNPTSETISVLDINSNNAKEFINLVKTLKPKCLEMSSPICPGDRLE
jgi:serine/threonine-protein kinase